MIGSDYPLISKMAMENGPFISDFPIKAPIHRVFSIAMFDSQRVEEILQFNILEIIQIIPIHHGNPQSILTIVAFVSVEPYAQHTI